MRTKKALKSSGTSGPWRFLKKRRRQLNALRNRPGIPRLGYQKQEFHRPPQKPAAELRTIRIGLNDGFT
jgi:hypothetical protein